MLNENVKLYLRTISWRIEWIAANKVKDQVIRYTSSWGPGLVRFYLTISNESALSGRRRRQDDRVPFSQWSIISVSGNAEGRGRTRSWTTWSEGLTRGLWEGETLSESTGDCVRVENERTEGQDSVYGRCQTGSCVEIASTLLKLLPLKLLFLVLDQYYNGKSRN